MSSRKKGSRSALTVILKERLKKINVKDLIYFSKPGYIIYINKNKR